MLGDVDINSNLFFSCYTGFEDSGYCKKSYKNDITVNFRNFFL